MVRSLVAQTRLGANTPCPSQRRRTIPDGLVLEARKTIPFCRKIVKCSTGTCNYYLTITDGTAKTNRNYNSVAGKRNNRIYPFCFNNKGVVHYTERVNNVRNGRKKRKTRSAQCPVVRVRRRFATTISSPFIPSGELTRRSTVVNKIGRARSRSHVTTTE